MENLFEIKESKIAGNGVFAQKNKNGTDYLSS